LSLGAPRIIAAITQGEVIRSRVLASSDGGRVVYYYHNPTMPIFLLTDTMKSLVDA